MLSTLNDKAQVLLRKFFKGPGFEFTPLAPVRLSEVIEHLSGGSRQMVVGEEGYLYFK